MGTNGIESTAFGQALQNTRTSGLRLRNATTNSKELKSRRFGTKDPAYDAISKAAELHEESLSYGRILEASYSTNLFFVLGFNVGVVTTTCTSIMMNLHEPVQLIRYTMVAIGLAIHLFFLSWPGQQVIDASNAVLDATYDNEWYETSVESQQLLKFIMLRAKEPFVLTAGGFYVMNFENFEMFMKTAASYITVLLSFQ